MPKIRVNGINVHYLTVGRGPDIVMLHGFLGNLAVWHLNIVPALQRKFRITTLDLRGHGYSEVTSSGYTTEELAADLWHLLDALEIKHPTLVGHSYGADVCMHFSSLYPEQVAGLVAVEPGLAVLVDERKCKDWEGWSYWVSKLEEVGIEVPPDKRTDLDYLFTVSLETPKFYGPARGLPRKRDHLLNLVNNTTLIEDYEVVGSLTKEAIQDINIPTLLVYGENSHFLGTNEFLKKALPNNRSVLLPGGEHFGPLEQPEQLVEHIQRFVKDLNSGPIFIRSDGLRGDDSIREVTQLRLRDKQL